jgi:hypothetical protein
VFIPTWNGNRDEPEDSQIKVHYRFPTVDHRDRYVKKYPMEFEGDTVKFKIETDDKGMFKAMVKRIENLEAEDAKTGAVKKIETAEDLLNAKGLERLYDEITSHLMNAQAVNRKNS